MMWGYKQLPDETQIAYSDVREDGAVLIGIERPRDWGFDSAHCLLPSFRWNDIDGFDVEEIAGFESLLRNDAPLIFDLAERGHGESTVA